jgi:GGDEF domain-containing protein
MFENRPDWLKLVDEESGLYNRLFLIHHLSEAFARSVRYGTPLSCLLIQAKWWRRLDEIEQSADAAAAHKLAQFLLLNVRTGDILERWTRDTFLLVASNTPPEGMRALIRIIASKAEELGVCLPAGGAVSVHAGVAGLPDDKECLRHPEAMPLLARERLTPVFRAGPRGGTGHPEKFI